jgi:hypothetical protein
MSFAILFSGNPIPQYYNAASAVHAIATAMRIDPKFGKVIGVALNVSPFRSL